MRKKLIGLIFALLLVVPFVFMLSACKDDATVTGVKVTINDAVYKTTDNDTITFEYSSQPTNLPDEIKVELTYSDGTTGEIECASSGYSITGWTAGQSDFAIGEHLITIKYGSYADIEVTVNITKDSNTITRVACDGFTYGASITQADFESAIIVTAGHGGDTATYKYATRQSDNTAGEYTTTLPTAAGNYYLQTTIAAGATYEGATKLSTFTIAKADAPVPTGADAQGSLSGTYSRAQKLSNISFDSLLQSKYTWVNPDEIPTCNKTVYKAYYNPDKANYNDIEVDITVNLQKADNAINGFAMANFTYGEYQAVANQPTYTSTTFGTPTYTYAKAQDGTYSSDLLKSDTAAGIYWVKATIAASDNYKEFSSIISFTINQKELAVSIKADSVSKAFNNADQTLAAADLDNFDAAKMEIVSGATGKTVGTYYLMISLKDTTNYKWASGVTVENGKAKLTWTISQVENTWSAAWANTSGWAFGAETKTTPTRTATYGTATYEYALMPTNSSTPVYSSTVPTAAGTYLVKANVAATTDYTALEDTQEFTITQATNNAWGTWANTTGWTYGDAIKITPTITATYGSDTITYIYYKDSIDEANIVTNIADAGAGDYIVVASIAGTANYNALTGASQEFTIAQKEVSAPTLKGGVTFTYNGSVQTLTADNLNGFESFMALTENTATNKGNYTAKVALTNGNYKWATSAEAGLDGKVLVAWSIGQAVNTWKTDWSNTAGWTYGDATKTTPTRTANFGEVGYVYRKDNIAGEVVEDITTAGAGTYVVVATVAGTDNYTVLTADTTFVISAKEITSPSIKADANLNYTSNERTLAAADLDNFDAAKMEITSGNKATNVEPKTLVITITDTNYTFAEGKTNVSLNWSLVKVDNAITSFTIEGWTYGGAHSTPTLVTTFAGTPTYNFAVTEETLNYGGDNVWPTDVGNYTAKVTIAGTDNFNEITQTCTFRIKIATPVEGTDYTLPTNLTGVNGAALSTIALPNGFVWVDGGTGTYLGTEEKPTGVIAYAAMFTPASTNYSAVQVLINVNVTCEVDAANVDTLAKLNRLIECKIKTFTITANLEVLATTNLTGCTITLGEGVEVTKLVTSMEDLLHANTYAKTTKLASDIAPLTGRADAELVFANNFTGTLDLNGHNINSAIVITNRSANGIFNDVDVTLSIINSAYNADDEATFSTFDCDCDYAIFVRFNRAATINLTNINAQDKEAGIYTNGLYSANVTINATNCNFKGTGTENVGAYLAANYIYNFTDCEFEGNTATYIKRGAATFTNCEMVATGTYTKPTFNGNGCDETGSALVIDNAEGYSYKKVGGINVADTFTINVVGGTYTSANGYAIENVLTSKNSDNYLRTAVVTIDNTAILSGDLGTYSVDVLTEEDLLTNAQNQQVSNARLVNDIAYNGTIQYNGFAYSSTPYVLAIDMNGHNLGKAIRITNASNTEDRYNTINLTINNSVAGSGKLGTDNTTDSVGVILRQLDTTAEASLYIAFNNVNIYGDIYALATSGNDNGIYIKADNTSFNAVRQAGDCTGVYLPASATCEFTNCQFTGTTGAYVKSGSCIFNNCTFTGNGDYQTISVTVEDKYPNGDRVYNGCFPNGSALVIDSCGAYKRPMVIALNNCVFNSTNGYGFEVVATAKTAETKVCYVTVVTNGTQTFNRNALKADYYTDTTCANSIVSASEVTPYHYTGLTALPDNAFEEMGYMGPIMCTMNGLPCKYAIMLEKAALTTEQFNALINGLNTRFGLNIDTTLINVTATYEHGNIFTNVTEGDSLNVIMYQNNVINFLARAVYDAENNITGYEVGNIYLLSNTNLFAGAKAASEAEYAKYNGILKSTYTIEVASDVYLTNTNYENGNNVVTEYYLANNKGQYEYKYRQIIDLTNKTVTLVKLNNADAEIGKKVLNYYEYGVNMFGFTASDDEGVQAEIARRVETYLSNTLSSSYGTLELDFDNPIMTRFIKNGTNYIKEEAFFPLELSKNFEEIMVMAMTYFMLPPEQQAALPKEFKEAAELLSNLENAIVMFAIDENGFGFVVNEESNDISYLTFENVELPTVTTEIDLVIDDYTDLAKLATWSQTFGMFDLDIMFLPNNSIITEAIDADGDMDRVLETNVNITTLNNTVIVSTTNTLTSVTTNIYKFAFNADTNMWDVFNYGQDDWATVKTASYASLLTCFENYEVAYGEGSAHAYNFTEYANFVNQGNPVVLVLAADDETYGITTDMRTWAAGNNCRIFVMVSDRGDIQYYYVNAYNVTVKSQMSSNYYYGTSDNVFDETKTY